MALPPDERVVRVVDHENYTLPLEKGFVSQIDDRTRAVEPSLVFNSSTDTDQT